MSRAFVIAFSIQIVLMILAFAVSTVLQSSHSDLSKLDAEASSHRLHFQTISALSQEITQEVVEDNPSQSYISGMQLELLSHVEQLRKGVTFDMGVNQASWFFAKDSRQKIDEIRSTIKPSLDRFLERNNRLATSNQAEIRERYSRLNTTDMASAASGLVAGGLEEISLLSKKSSEALTNNLFVLNIIINSLSIAMIALVGGFIIRPALRQQATAIEREQKNNVDLQKTVGQLVDSEARAVTLYQEAKEADRTKGEFLAVMSHELRTPLNAINGFSEILANEMFGAHNAPQYKGYSEAIHESGTHLLSIINDILDFSRMDINRLELDENDVVLCDLLRTSTRMLEPDAEAAKIKVTLTAVPNHICRFRGDTKRVQQAIINVTSNAIKFSDPGTEVEVALAIPEDGGYCISVSDRGDGIPVSLIPKIGTPFTQEESSLVRSKGGLGLGLAITKAIMTAHDGQLDIENRYDKGTIVHLRFPAARAIELTDDGAAKQRKTG